MNVSSLFSSAAVSSISSLSSVSSSAQAASTSSIGQDSSGISDLGKLLKQLAALQKTDPAKFKQVTAEVAKKLQEAAQSAAADGDTQTADALNSLASKFTTASETGKLPQLHGGGHGHRLDNDGDSSNDTASTGASANTSTSNSAADKYKLAVSNFQEGSGSDPLSTLTKALSSALSA